MNIKTKRVMDHYEIYVDDKFYCTCDTNELTPTIRSIEEEYETENEQSSNN